MKEPKIFRAIKKPIEIQVFQFTKEMLPKKIDKKRFEPKKLEDGRIEHTQCIRGESNIRTESFNVYLYFLIYKNNRIRCFILTPEGDMEFNVGDYILKGIRGEFYPIKKDIFEESYKILR